MKTTPAKKAPAKKAPAKKVAPAKKAAQSKKADNEVQPEDCVDEVIAGGVARYVGKKDPKLPFAPDDVVFVESRDPDDEDGWIVTQLGASPDDAINVFGEEVVPVEDLAEVEEALAIHHAGGSEYDKAKGEEATENALPEVAKKTATKKAAASEESTPAKKTAPAKKVAAKKAPAKKVAAPKEVVPPKELVLTKSVKAAMAGKSAVAAARSLVQKAQMNDYNLGGVLCKIQRDEDYTSEIDPETDKPFVAGKEGFTRFVELDLGIKYEKGRYLIRFYETFSGIKDIDEALIAKVSYAKAREIFDIVEQQPDKAGEWLQLAADEKLVDLKTKTIKARKKLGIERTPRGMGGQGNAGAEMTTVKLRLFNDQAKILERAIEMAKAKIEVTDKDTDDTIQNKAIVFILSDWVELNS